ncbi:hypothetical protein SEVIR_5G090000v4 [Setaria viridis]|uniref:Uncharacterized protein n=1 Tax=Setaria viridis TaxID=4556 RepID=A0A4U6UQT5_SETVI|nr:hypothetical protein SEVIR_5G090000v2 [Setaria viridis]
MEDKNVKSCRVATWKRERRRTGAALTSRTSSRWCARPARMTAGTALASQLASISLSRTRVCVEELKWREMQLRLARFITPKYSSLDQLPRGQGVSGQIIRRRMTTWESLFHAARFKLDAVLCRVMMITTSASDGLSDGTNTRCLGLVD